ncbi:ABC transporter-related protein [Anaeromyxobacter sp. K]|uniref:ABC transporter related n=1 Tax=Anaeromyxobacter dehalogenans (strain ATCC BAA-258 / DSM 21875 / 2CP-1) TaxID=455488 RepID=B8J8C5_ANAD2|nr:MULTISPECIES: ABC transporter ATP-binding protein [Anaeromyxobacter]ACG73226.1 ABC transporter-related protein [Anaeromyxobacter sp. K]ACL65424.1 ABC transporter related [Anaeromyxobacter dehalogenans 2CP-1]
MIEVRDLWKSFGTNQVLKGITLDVPKGNTYVVLGGSGSGKTVLMKHVIGLLKPDRGTVRVGEHEISSLTGRELNEARRMFGMVFQGAALFDSMNVFDNVAFPLREKRRGTRLAASEVRKRVIEKLAVVDLGEEVLGRWPAELSGGMRKRVALARALVSDPQVVLYDEPTTGLDPITTNYVDEMIVHAKERLGITSMVISHDIASAFRVADRLAVLYDGHLAAEGTPAEVRQSKDPFVQRFLSTWFEKQ